MRSRQSGPAGPLPPFGAAAREAGPKPTGIVRDRRILRALWFSLPVIVLAFLVGTALLSLQLWSWMALRDATGGQADAAKSAYQRQQTLTAWGPAPWVSQYNLGTVELLAGNTEEGLGHLAEAFLGVPKAIPAEDGTIQTFSYECQVRINLAVGWESVADTQRASSDLDQSIVSYDQALEWVKPCQMSGGGSDSDDQSQSGGGGEGGGGGGGGSPQEDQGASTSERIDQKRQEAQREKSGEPEAEQPQQDGNGEPKDGEGKPQEGTGNPSDDPFAGETPAERQRREELEEKNRQQQEAQRERDEATHRNPGTNGW